MKIELEQFRKHPSIYPFLGENYNKARKKIFVVGESHYFNNENNIIDNTSWYDLSDSEFVEKMNIKEGTDWFNTEKIVRDIQNKYNLDMNVERSKKLIWIIPRCMYEVKYGKIPSKKQTCEQIKEIGFFNFFSRPMYRVGKTLNVTKRDKEAANEKFDFIINQYKPDLIIFLSKKAYYALDDKQKMDRNILSLRHPAYYAGWSYQKNDSSFNRAKMAIQNLYI